MFIIKRGPTQGNKIITCNMLLGSKNLCKFVKNKKCMKVYNSQRFFFFLSKKVCNFWWEFTYVAAVHIIRRVSVCNSESDVHKARLVNCMILSKIEIYL